MLISLQLPHQTQDEVLKSLDELSALAYSLGGKIVGQMVQARQQIHPGSFFGKGKLEEVKNFLKQNEADAVLIDNPLSPKQTQNLEKFLDCVVLDRTQVILEIFANNARTREAKLQIRLAQSEYLLPRLVGLWKHLDRERGGIGASRGTGEKQLEKDRQFLRQRITHLKDQIKRVDRERKTQKQRRSECLQVSLIGYTNAGKSTIMNALTESELLAEDRLFATLDSTTRLLEEDSRPKVLLSDTVGFIRNLPHEVVAAFRSTMTSVQDADLLLHVIDASDDFEDHIKTTEEVLEDLNAVCIPVLKVFNKIDQLEPTRLMFLKKMYPDAAFVSALSGGIEALRELVLTFFEKRMQTITISLDYQHTQNLSDIYEWCRVDCIDYQEEGILMTLTGIPGNINRLRHHLGISMIEMS